ncbi:phage tail protein [Aliivibrio fischeri]|uniref:phage tail sheath subtilisin-like domain-containing protein n=1 Tax=Aliivibrio fischeri TaxID=668 RepID=UPI0012D9AB26|nr:phage tail sheath subtilisin-like domain-containing protein [Aliivibrio fischeri]MUH95227.1 phage tail protein [Aliivibrio fischeri]MUI65455.1 phage tail protein [Aliivibrio fischeri]MUK76204.1 phage tail protein [Aliivibrio fischeri]
MSISFSEVPSNARVPGVYIEIDNSLANSAEPQQIALVIGNAVAGAKVTPNTVVLCLDEESAREQFGESDIAAMVKYFTKQNESMPVYAISVESADTMSALAALGDTQYNHIICSLNDNTTIRDLGEFLDARYKALEMIPGIAYLPKQGTHAELVTFGATTNCPLISFMSINALVDSKNTPLTEAEAVAAWAGQIAPSLANDPCRPLQTLKLAGVYSIASDDFDWTERNLLLHEGMGTYTVTATGEVQVERPVTAYTENAAGVEDDSYLDVMTPATAMYFREKQRSLIQSKFGRHKLAKDGTRFAPGQAIVTPSIIKGELLTLYKTLEYNGIVQDFDGYKQSLIVELDESNKTRINYRDSPQFVNGLIITAGKIQFRK